MKKYWYIHFTVGEIWINERRANHEFLEKMRLNGNLFLTKKQAIEAQKRVYKVLANFQRELENLEKN